MTKRVVVKLGSGVFSSGGRGLTRRFCAARRRRRRGAGAGLGGGRRFLGGDLRGPRTPGLAVRPSTQLKQAAAAVGQSRLMRAWEAAFARPEDHGRAGSADRRGFAQLKKIIW